jgi:hypothetical protein
MGILRKESRRLGAIEITGIWAEEKAKSALCAACYSCTWNRLVKVTPIPWESILATSPVISIYFWRFG